MSLYSLQLDTETIVRAGATNIIDRDYDNLGRASGFDLDSDYKVNYGYDTFGRMNSVSSMDQSAEYSYLPGSDLISGYTMGDLSVTRSFEPNRNLITEIENKFDANTVSKYSYANDAGGRRISVIQTGTAFQPVGDMFNLYQYNTRSELTSAERYFGSNTNDISNPVGLQDWSYAYDHIGNRTWTTKANAAASYTANALNQYTERSVPGSSDIIGSAKTNVTVTVNEEEADRQGYYWSHRLTVDNLFNPIYTQIVVEAICDPGTNDPFVVSSETGNVFVAESPESFTYDEDGNLLSDGRFNYSWDGENRLISATTKNGLPEDMPLVHVEFEYDYMSRRIGKTVYQWDAGIINWTKADSRSFLYDGWLLVQEQSASGGNITTNFYVHGLDLSGSLQGAGGIGGLLASYSSSTSHPVLFCYDANGNVSELLSTNGTILAHYEYSPFGETIVATGPLATANKFRFSTKYFCDEFGMGDWGYRWYSPSMGRWLSRDPIGEEGAANLYTFVENASINLFDLLGLTTAGDILNAFFSTNTTSGLWIMGADDDYTKKVRSWTDVQVLVDIAKNNLKLNCDGWEKNHTTTPSWTPGRTGGHRILPATDPKAYPGWANSPSGTDAETAKRAFQVYILTGYQNEALWKCAIGSFGLYATVDKIDCCKKTATMKFWMYNSMTQGSFGRHRKHFPNAAMATQYMWWNWTEEFDFAAASNGGGGTSGSGGGW